MSAAAAGSAFEAPMLARVLRHLLGGYQQVRGVPRVLYWLRHFAFGKPVISITTPDGLPATIEAADYGQVMLFYFPYARGQQSLLRDVLRPGDRCIDLGANVGLLTIVMARAVGPSGFVLAVDANGAAAEQIRLTATLADFTNIEVLHAGVAGRCGVGELVKPPGTNSESFEVRVLEGRDERAGAADLLRLESVDSLIQRISTRGETTFIKMDVEGEEARLLESMREALASDVRPAMLIEFHTEKCRRRGVSADTIREGLRLAGYDERIVSVCGDDYVLEKSESPLQGTVNVLYIASDNFEKSERLAMKWAYGA